MNVARTSELGATGGPSRQDLTRIYEQTKTIAAVGASANERKADHLIPKYLQSQGYRIIPVNPKVCELLGECVYPSLEEIDVPVDVVDVFRSPAEAETNQARLRSQGRVSRRRMDLDSVRTVGTFARGGSSGPRD